jgi:DNA-binding protein HU-beta
VSFGAEQEKRSDQLIELEVAESFPPIRNCSAYAAGSGGEHCRFRLARSVVGGATIAVVSRAARAESLSDVPRAQALARLMLELPSQYRSWRSEMNQSELIERVAQATELNEAAAGRAVKAVINAIVDGLVAGEAVRISGLGTFNVAARSAREGRNPQNGETIAIPATKVARFHAGKAVKEALNPPPPKRAARKKAASPNKSGVRK